MKANIKGISYYLPEDELSNEKISEIFPEWSINKISSKIGISNRRIAAKEEFTSDLAVAAGEKFFAEHSIDRSSIDYILLCTQSPDYFLPTTACLVQSRLNIPTTAGAIDINQGCSGYIYGLSLAKGLIASEDFNNVLLITAEAYSKFIHPKDKSNKTIFGDAATATLITSATGKATIGRFSVGTDGNGAENLIVKHGAMRYARDENDELATDTNGNAYNNNYLFMNGAEIFNFTLDAVPALIAQTLQKNNVSAEDIDLYVFHQANRFMLNHLRKKLNIAEEKFFIYMENCGNTVSSTIPIALQHALLDEKIKPGSKVLIAGFGVGYSWGGTILQF